MLGEEPKTRLYASAAKPPPKHGGVRSSAESGRAGWHTEAQCVSLADAAAQSMSKALDSPAAAATGTAGRRSAMMIASERRKPQALPGVMERFPSRGCGMAVRSSSRTPVRILSALRPLIRDREAGLEAEGANCMILWLLHSQARQSGSPAGHGTPRSTLGSLNSVGDCGSARHAVYNRQHCGQGQSDQKNRAFPQRPISAV